MRYYNTLKKDTSTRSQSGFTLIEISLVVVIIGLVVGGVLVGRDLITAAEIRASVAQIEKYNTAIHTFKSKYGSLPGDISATSAAEYGMTARTGTDGHGDGDGLLEGCAANATQFGCETAMMWTDLSFANLISGNFTSAIDSTMQLVILLNKLMQHAGSALEYVNPVQSAHATSLRVSYQKDQAMPRFKSGAGNFLTVFTANGRNYYQVANIASTDPVGDYTLAGGLTPVEAFAIDQKVDNGMPLSGIVMAMGGSAALNVVAVPSPLDCVFTGGQYYNTRTPDIRDRPVCQLRVEIK